MDSQKFFITLKKALMDPKPLVLLTVAVALPYFVGGEWVVKPGLAKLSTLDGELASTQQSIDQKQQELQKLQQMANQAKAVKTTINALTPGQSPKVVAVAESKHLIDLAKGALAPDSAPGSKPSREFLAIASKSEALVDILAPAAASGGAPGSDAAAPPPDGTAAPAAPGGVNVWKYDYELRLKGSYPALAAFLNDIVASKTLIAIQKVTFQQPGAQGSDNATSGEGTEDSNKPGAYGDDKGNVPVEMVIALSLYLHEPKP